MKALISIALAFLVLAACGSSGSRSDGTRSDGTVTRATSAVSGLEEVTILARGME